MKYVPPLNGDRDNKERPYINANPVHGEEGSILNAIAIEHPLREIVNTIKGAGLTPNGEDLSQLQQAILTYIEQAVPVNQSLTEEFRLSRIGNIDIGNKVIRNQSFVPADGRLVLFANYPELKAKLDDTSLDSIVYDETGLIRAEYLGRYMYTEDRTGVYVPELGGRFIRSWTDGQSIDSERGFGSVQGDAIRNITGTIGGVQGENVYSNGAFSHHIWGRYAAEAHGELSTNYMFDASRVVPTANENRPQNIALHATLYLGRYIDLQEVI